MEKKRENMRFELNSDIANVINLDGHLVFCIGSATIDLIARPTDVDRYGVSVWVQCGHSRKQVLSVSWDLTREEYLVLLDESEKSMENICYESINGKIASRVARDIFIYLLAGTAFPGLPPVDFDDQKYYREWKTLARKLINKHIAENSHMAGNQCYFKN